MTHTPLPPPPTMPSPPESKGRPMVFPTKVLQKITAAQLSGRFTFTDPNDKSVAWQVYTGNGQIHYANSLNGQLDRLTYLLGQLGVRLRVSLQEGQSDYQWLCQLWQSGSITLPQLRKLLFLVTQEALVHLLSMPQAEVDFDRVLGLETLVHSVPVRQLVLPMRSEITQWTQLRTTLSSPLQRLTIIQPEQLAQYAWDHGEQRFFIESLSARLLPEMTLYGLAHALNLPGLELAQSLKPLIDAGFIGISPFACLEPEQRPLVACIDDSKTVQRNVRLILETSGYEVMSLMEPARAISALARQKPNLVLMDITMPEVDGYELCRMFRQSDLLKDVPIVMLTGRDGLIDRIRARMVGATDYLTKPFTPQELLTLAERFAHEPVAATSV